MWRYLLMSLGPALLAWAAHSQGIAAELAAAIGIATALCTFVIGEALAPGMRSVGVRTIVRDIGHAALSSGTAQICLVAATFVLGFVDRETLEWPLWLQVALVVVGSDFLSYWAHRAQHRVSWLWKPHAVHHAPSELYWLNGLRAHPGDAAFAFGVSTLWVLVAGFSTAAFAIAGVVLTSHLLLQHTRIAFPKALTALFVTPAWHRVHHEKDLEGEAANLGQILTVWDRWFGTEQPGRAEARLGRVEQPRFWDELLLRFD